LGTYEGGREKAPAAISRKVAEAEDGSEIEIWGDGRQTRSFCYIDDCVDGLMRLMRSCYTQPINLGTNELITVDGLVDLVCSIAGKRLDKVHDFQRPQGVRGRNSDNSLLRRVLGWEPTTTLREGLTSTYPWIWSQLQIQGRARPPAPRIEEMILVPTRSRLERAREPMIAASRSGPRRGSEVPQNHPGVAGYALDDESL
jgi:dTDP-D-glucose 4,6-dehydratase